MKKEDKAQKRAKNKEKRSLYVNLTEEINTNLCTFCKYSENDSFGCCEGYNYCTHPIERLCIIHEYGLEPGDDCWGFRRSLPLDSVVEIVSAIITNDFDNWGFIPYSETSFTVYGFTRNIHTGEMKSAKVRIGHNGKPVVKDLENSEVKSHE